MKTRINNQKSAIVMRGLLSSFKKLSLSLVFILIATAMQAQSSSPDFFQSIGKIYVVVVVVLISFLGIVFFLIYLERKLKRLEEEVKDLN